MTIQVRILEDPCRNPTIFARDPTFTMKIVTVEGYAQLNNIAFDGKSLTNAF
jgi:hypothetical protein